MLPPPNEGGRATASRSATCTFSANGSVHFDLTLPGPGHIDVLETAWQFNQAHAAAVLLQPAAGRFVFSRAHLDSSGAKTIRVTVKPNAGGSQLVHHYRGRRLRIRLWVTFQPAGGLPRSVGTYGILIAGT
jgi:hypothetical protein